MTKSAAELDTLRVVVTDLRMPRMGGLELVRRLRELRADLPALFVTGLSDSPPGEDEYALPNAAVLEKPFRAAELAEALDALLSASETGDE